MADVDLINARKRHEKIKLRTSNIKHHQRLAADSAANLW
jgi:hypothetical protein